MRPMLATPGALPSGPGWSFEVKWDGIRTLVSTTAGGVVVTGRSGADYTSAFPELTGLAAVVPPGTVLDGELVAMADGRPSFHSLAPRLHADARRAVALARTQPATLLAFDVLRLRDVDRTARPYDERRGALADLALDGPAWQAPAAFDDGDALWRATAEQSLEGVVAKRRGSPYRPGVRHPDWVKVPHRRTRSYVVGGYRPGTSPAPHRLGSLLVGTPVGDAALRYDGAVGSGLSATAQRALREVLDGLRVAAPAFDPAAPLPADGVWCEPVLVVDVAHLGRSGHGLLRQPAVVRLRPDRGYDDVLRDGG